MNIQKPVFTKKKRKGTSSKETALIFPLTLPRAARATSRLVTAQESPRNFPEPLVTSIFQINICHELTTLTIFMPFDSVVLFLGIHPKDIIQKHVNALYTKIFTIGAFIIGKKKALRTMCLLPYKRGMIQETMICPLETKWESSKIMGSHDLWYRGILVSPWEMKTARWRVGQTRGGDWEGKTRTECTWGRSCERRPWEGAGKGLFHTRG